MAKLIRENGGGHRQVRRADGRTEQFARSLRWRIRYGLFYPDGSRVIQSKLTGRRADATLLRGEASRLERLTRTATATQQDLGHFLRMGLISQDDYVRLGGANLLNLIRAMTPSSSTIMTKRRGTSHFIGTTSPVRFPYPLRDPRQSNWGRHPGAPADGSAGCAARALPIVAGALMALKAGRLSPLER
jgi:hypothetical protein